MKKIWFIVLFILTLVTLSGCVEVSTEETGSKETVETEAFVFELLDLNGHKLIDRTINFPINEQYSLIDLIDDAVDLDYDVYPFGIFINGIGGFYPKEYNVTYNYFFGLYVNDISTTSGLDTVTVTKDTKITFKEISMLDEIDLLVDQKIDLFIKNYLSQYVNNDVVEHNVMLAIRQLEAKGYEVPSIPSLFTSAPTLLRNTIGNAFKSSITERALGLSLVETNNYLNNQTPTNPYEAISLMQGLIISNAELSKINLVAEFIMDNDPSFMDSDYAAMAITALSVIKSDTLSHTVDTLKVNEYILEKLDYIKENLTVDGVSSWGNANSATTSTVIISLASLGLDPRNEEFTTEDKDLIEALLAYEIDGSFKYMLTSESADLAFSTPQAFAALVAYKIYRDDFFKPPFNIILLPTRTN